MKKVEQITRDKIEHARRLFFKMQSNRQMICLLFFVSALVILPMFFLGIFNDRGDIFFHLQTANAFSREIPVGNFYPSWTALENFGYGSVGIRFYPPAVSFLIGLTKIFIGSWSISTCLVFFLFTFVGSVGAYLWAKEYLAPQKAIWAGILLLIMPYHLCEIYTATMFSEYAGVSILPFVFLFITRVCRDGKLSSLVGLTASYAVLVLTHLPLTVIGSLSFLFYALLILPKKNILPTLLKLGSAAIFGLGASSIYLSRMIFEQNWLRNAQFWTDDHFDYRSNFLFTSTWSFDRPLWFLNIVFALLIVCCVFWTAAIYRAEKDKVNSKPLIYLCFGSMIMMTVLSQPIWMIVPYLKETQFPWRWMSVVSVSASVIGAIGIDYLKKSGSIFYGAAKQIKIIPASILVASITIYALVLIGFQLQSMSFGEYETWVNSNSSQMGMQWFWTPQTKESAFTIKEKVVAENRQTEIISWNSEERLFRIEPGQVTDARVATLFYPYWKASVNGTVTELKMSGDGAILVPLGNEKSEVKIWFEEPFRVKVAAYISLFCWLVIFSAAAFSLRRPKINFQNELQLIETQVGKVNSVMRSN